MLLADTPCVADSTRASHEHSVLTNVYRAIKGK